MARRNQRRPVRRRGRHPAAPDAPAPILPRIDFLLAGLLGAAVLVLVAAVVLLAGDGGGDERTEDEKAIEALARRSIEVLPGGEWPSLYDSFTADYQQRCTQEAFAQAGREAETQLGADLAKLAFVRLEQLAVQGDSASAVVVGRVRDGGEYSVRGAFRRVDGAWKIAPAAGTEGCNAFDRISG